MSLTRLLSAGLLWIGKALYWSGLHRVVIRWRPRAVRALLYHACEDVESDFIRGLRSNTRPADLDLHLQFVARNYSVVPSESLARPRLPPRPAVITFDDGYGSVYQNARPVLNRRRVPATVYLITSVIDSRALVWVNAANWLLARDPERTVPELARALGCREEESAHLLIEEARTSVPPEAIDRAIRALAEAGGSDPDAAARDASLYLKASEIREMANEGHSFGNHTHTHPNLPNCSEARVDEEIRRGHEAVVALLGDCPTFAYPFGAVGTDTRARAEAAGYRVIMGVGGAPRRGSARVVPRTPIHSRSAAGLFAELEVLNPIKGWVRRIQARRGTSRGQVGDTGS